jgi:hypothetical protein
MNIASPLRFHFFWVFVLTLTLPAGVVLSTHLARASFEKVKLRDQTITVKGTAERQIAADRATWTASLITRHTAMIEAHRALEADRLRLLAYLAEGGFEPDAVTLGPMDINPVYSRDDKGYQTSDIVQYVLSQHFTIAGNDVGQVAALAREVDSLISEGLELSSAAPSYLYTRLDDVKMQLLAEATLNARQRAEQLVANSPSRLGALRSANQGVFQITPVYSTEVTDSGRNDTSTIDKTVRAVVTIEYGIE